MYTQLVATKYHGPPLNAGRLPRPHLLLRLDDALHDGRRLMLLSAPAGYGKTTLLTQWVERHRRVLTGDEDGIASPSGAACAPVRIAWLTLDAGDNDPLRFLTYLVAALRQVVPQSCTTTAALLQAGVPNSMPVLLPALANDIGRIAFRVVLILDDYHVLSAQAVHDSVAFLLKYAPENLSIVISTRIDPPLALAQLRGHGRMVELRQHELRFSLDEASQLLAGMSGEPLAPALVMKLHERTEGWAAGLQMAAISLLRHNDVARFVTAFSGSHRHILDYLSEQVLDSQPPHVQEFLMRTSILTQLCAPLCQALFWDRPDMGDTQPLLELLEQDNLFTVALDDQRCWYRYHNLFADLLRQRLATTDPSLIAALHRRACQWYAGAGLMHEAVEHALQADDFDQAAALIARAAESVMKNSEVATLRRWIELLPDTALRTRPILYVYHGGAMLLMGETVSLVDARLRTAFSSSPDAKAGGAAATFQALAAALQGEDEASDRLAQRALALLPEHSPFFRSCVRLVAGINALFAGRDAAGATALRDTLALADAAGDVMNSVLARCYLGQLFILQQRMGAAYEVYEQALTWSRDEPIGGLPLLGLGLLLYDRNEMELADARIIAGLSRVSEWSDIPASQATLLLARIKRLAGDITAAEHLEHRAELLTAQAPEKTPFRRALELYQMRHALWKGDLPAAEYHAANAGLIASEDDAGVWTDRTPCHGAIEDAPETAFTLLALARLNRAHGQLAAARTAAVKVAEHSHRQGRMRLVAKAYIQHALVDAAARDMQRAAGWLERAFAIAAPDGCVRLFVDEGEPMAELLEICRRRSAFGRYAAQLLAAYAPDASLAQSSSGIVRYSEVATSGFDPLSNRELQVLVLMADGYSNREIAQRLGVADSTVKTHVNAIFRKLDVTHRTQAVARARTLRLL